MHECTHEHERAFPCAHKRMTRRLPHRRRALTQFECTRARRRGSRIHTRRQPMQATTRRTTTRPTQQRRRSGGRECTPAHHACQSHNVSSQTGWCHRCTVTTTAVCDGDLQRTARVFAHSDAVFPRACVCSNEGLTWLTALLARPLARLLGVHFAPPLYPIHPSSL
jgi:hypothetical protein